MHTYIYIYKDTYIYIYICAHVYMRVARRRSSPWS